MILFTGLPSYFFHPRRLPIERQNRAIALSYYGSGPLAFLPLTVVLAAIPIALFYDHPLDFITWVFAACLLLANLFACWYTWSCIGRRVLQRPIRRLTMTWVLPILWCALGVAVAVVPPLLIVLVEVIFFSLFDAI